MSDSSEDTYKRLIAQARDRIREIDTGAAPLYKEERSRLAFFVTVSQGFQANTEDPLRWNPDDLDPEWVLKFLTSDPAVKLLLEGA